jgi:hypothetical protein
MNRRNENKWRDFEELVFRIILIILLVLGGMKLIVPEVKELMAKIEGRDRSAVEVTEGAPNTSSADAR